jgi:hypothetical protein
VSEQKILEGIQTPYNKYPIPIIWATSVVNRARKEHRITNDIGVGLLLQVNIIVRSFSNDKTPWHVY